MPLFRTRLLWTCFADSVVASHTPSSGHVASECGSARCVPFARVLAGRFLVCYRLAGAVSYTQVDTSPLVVQSIPTSWALSLTFNQDAYAIAGEDFTLTLRGGGELDLSDSGDSVKLVPEGASCVDGTAKATVTNLLPDDSSSASEARHFCHLRPHYHNSQSRRGAWRPCADGSCRIAGFVY